MSTPKLDQLENEYLHELEKLEKEYNMAKKKLAETLVNTRNKVEAIEKFQRNHNEGKSFADFVDAMKTGLRIIIICDNLHIIVLNDPNVEFLKPLWGSGMKGFTVTEQEMRWWEYTPAAYQANYEFRYENGRLHVRLEADLGLASWYVSNDNEILKYGYLRTYEIKYPSAIT
jgi:hypothetical protein